jgi:hypothetical protein
MEMKQFNELLLQSLEHEKGGVQIYQTALKCVLNEDLRDEWEKYLDQTREHVRILTELLVGLKVDPYLATPGRQVVRYTGASLVQAMQMALTSGPAEAAQLVACECVVLAETKDHLNWELIGKCAEKLSGDARQALQQAVEQVEEQEDEHLYHSKGWCRELWIDALGMQAILPPPEEVQNVKTALDAAKAEQSAPQRR